VVLPVQSVSVVEAVVDVVNPAALRAQHVLRTAFPLASLWSTRTWLPLPA
jgi:hypothetical protein